jgi:DNA-binding protein HU-beta
MSVVLTTLRQRSSRPIQKYLNVGSTKASFFWSTPEILKSSPPPENTSLEDVDSLTTTHLVKAVAETHELSQAESRRVVKTIFDTIMEGVAEKKVVRIGGFGSFYSATSKATTARNPRTGEPISVPEKQRVKFRPYNEFKKSVSE